MPGSLPRRRLAPVTISAPFARFYDFGQSLKFLVSSQGLDERQMKKSANHLVALNSPFLACRWS